MSMTELKLEEKEMRQVYSETILELAKKDPNVIALDADLMSSISLNKISPQISDQVINCGIMEANMMGVAAGFSLTNKIPFVHTFAQFATRRAFDQLFVSLAYAKLNVKILGSDAGVTAEHNGGTHMAFEDLGLVRLIPNATVYEASDSTMLRKLLIQNYKEYGVHYIRTTRKKAVKIYDENETFPKGKGKLLRDGTDVCIVASGIMVAEALQAARELEKKSIDAMVIDMYSIKPVDAELLTYAAEKTGLIITAENHNVIGGLGSAVAETLSEIKPVPIKRVGVREKFGQVGKVEYLKEFYGLTANHIANIALENLGK
ncbi:transketolase family protein [Fervidibacillus halotolerans]|uniref:Transketolase family protein n=1 Tax=Fervidibacillus halotolerans TaxID=2980027 RepID=A0A9E8LYI1_9BACI|nr:transketolase C-terminal domain-containing protein [Fervidibacillus halotolerans]WAA12085.1 transketolase family protein [Fervidibacillus halotolerans]